MIIVIFWAKVGYIQIMHSIKLMDQLNQIGTVFVNINHFRHAKMIYRNWNFSHQWSINLFTLIKMSAWLTAINSMKIQRDVTNTRCHWLENWDRHYFKMFLIQAKYWHNARPQMNSLTRALDHSVEGKRPKINRYRVCAIDSHPTYWINKKKLFFNGFHENN